jgi:hypothetical protein
VNVSLLDLTARIVCQRIVKQKDGTSRACGREHSVLVKDLPAKQHSCPDCKQPFTFRGSPFNAGSGDHLRNLGELAKALSSSNETFRVEFIVP